MTEHTIQLHYFDSCPSWRTADRRLRDVLAELGADIEIEYVRARSPEDAQRLGFRGSPSVLIDGHDPFADASPAVGWACRLYRTESGLDGSPSVAQLRQVLGGLT